MVCAGETVAKSLKIAFNAAALRRWDDTENEYLHPGTDKDVNRPVAGLNRVVDTDNPAGSAGTTIRAADEDEKIPEKAAAPYQLSISTNSKFSHELYILPTSGIVAVQVNHSLCLLSLIPLVENIPLNDILDVTVNCGGFRNDLQAENIEVADPPVRVIGATSDKDVQPENMLL